MSDTYGCTPLARSHVYQFISAGFSYPDPMLVQLLQSRLPDTESCLLLLEDQHALEVLRPLKSVLLSCSPDTVETAYLQSFGHTISTECPPYEAEYDQAHIFQKSQALADIAGFYRAFGLELEPTLKDRLDHISVELEFMHFLCLKEAYASAKGHPEEQLALCREAQAKFLGDHLGQWVLAFVQRLEKKAVGNLYGLMGHLLTAFLTFEMRVLGLEPGEVGSPVLVEPPEEETPGCEACPLLVPTTG